MRIFKFFHRGAAAAGATLDAAEAAASAPAWWAALQARAAAWWAALNSRAAAWWAAQAPWRTELWAWWEGFELPDVPAPAIGGAEAAKAAGAPAAREAWSPSRVKIAELIWSDGFSFPGGADYVVKLVKPFGLTKEKSMLDLGCGLGGGTRAIAKAFACWNIGLEASPVLAAAGMAASEKAGMSKRAPIQHFDPATVDLPERKFDAIFGRHVLGPLKNKKRLLAQMDKALKPGGQLMFMDFVLSKAGARSPALAAWMAAEDQPPLPGTAEDFTRALGGLKIDVRIATDMTAEFRALVTEGWARLGTVLAPGMLDAEEMRNLAREIELWTKRLAALDAGDLQMVRVFGLKGG